MEFEAQLASNFSESLQFHHPPAFNVEICIYLLKYFMLFLSLIPFLNFDSQIKPTRGNLSPPL